MVFTDLRGILPSVVLLRYIDHQTTYFSMLNKLPVFSTFLFRLYQYKVIL